MRKVTASKDRGTRGGRVTKWLLTVCEECRRGRQQGRGEPVDVAPELVGLATCDGQNIGHVHDGDAHVGAPTRATQSVPPAVRRAVLSRDGGRCKVPGCRHATFVDVHHLVTRAEGGPNTADNLVTLCSAHHRAVHRGTLIAEGTASTGIAFFHADGIAYGASAVPAEGDAYGKARRALIALGYSARQARRALARGCTAPDASLETVVRQALLELTRAA